MFRKTRWCCFVGFVIVTCHTAFAQEEVITLQYGDGIQESKRSITGAGHVVRFQCTDKEQWYLKSIAVHASRYGTPKAPRDKFSVMVASEDLKEFIKIPKPYSLFERGDPKWVKLDVPAVEVPNVFQVGLFFNPTRTKGVYVGIDEDSSPTHSMTVVPTDPSKSKGDLKGDWMIKVFLTKTPPKNPRKLRNSKGNATEVAKLEKERATKLLGKTRSVTLKHDSGATDEHLNVRGAAYTVQFETPKSVEAYVWEAQIYAAQFGGQHDSEAVSGDIYVLDESRKVLSRTTFPYSMVTQEKQWVTIPTLPTRVNGKFFISIDTHGTKTKGMYVGYETKEKTKIASTDEVVGETIKPGDWSAKFADKQWLIRAKIADRPVAYGPHKGD